MKDVLTTFQIFIVILLITHGLSFNIDWKYPVIIQNRGGISSHVPNYFGAKVNLLTTDEGSAWILIGAPKANDSTVASRRDVFEPGVIWQCSIGREPADTCRPLVMDSEGNQKGNGGKVDTLKDGGWLGGPEGIALNSDSVVGCAPIWEKRDLKDNRTFHHGACFLRRKSDLFKSPLPPPSNIPMTPLDDPEIMSGNKLEKAMGLAGFSVHLPKTGNEIVMGAPGFWKSRGALIQYLSGDGGSSYFKKFVSDPSKYGQSSDKTPFNFNFLGYSLTSGHLLEEGLIQFVAGAPRGAELRGKVIIFRFPEKEGKGQQLKIFEEVEGDQTGCYFGSAVLALDVNGDGWDDLLVGVPRYSREMLKIRPMKRGLSMSASLTSEMSQGYDKFTGYEDEGAVYLYLSENGKGLRKTEQRIVGGYQTSAQFGTALTSLGDINRDGVNDFAISAPFEHPSGAIYIYLGSKSGKISEYSQVIYGKDVSPILRGFGYSLHGNSDVDRNGYPDLAVGSFNSSQVVIFRTKPLITVTGEVTSPQRNLPFDIQAFQVTSCVSFSGDYAPDSVYLEVGLKSDVKSRPGRVSLRFLDWNQPGAVINEGKELIKTAEIDYNVTVYKGRKTCTAFQAIVTPPLERSGAPVVFQQEISIVSPLEENVMPRIMAIDPSGGTSTSGERFSAFCARCPMINSGLPSKFELSLPLAVPCGEDGVCQSDLKLNVNFPNISPEEGFLIGSSDSLKMEISLENQGETAIAPAVLVSWWRLKLKKIPGDCHEQPEYLNQITYKCQLGQLLESGKLAETIILEFDISSLLISETQQISELIFNVTATTASEMTKGPVSTSMFVGLKGSADLFIEGSRVLEPFHEETKSHYVIFKHEFEIGMEGPSPVGNFEILFSLPVNLTTYKDGTAVNIRGVEHNKEFNCQPTNGQFSKEGMVIPPSGGDGEEDPDFEVGGIAISLPKEDVRRESSSTFKEKDLLMIHCDSPFVSCMEVTCKVVEYRPGKVSLVKFVIDIEANLIRNLIKVHKVEGIQVESKGKLILPEAIRKIQPVLNNKGDETIAATILMKEGYKPISKWIYTLAVVIGLLVLACVAFCLHSCGCFDNQRKRKGETEDEVDAAEMEPLRKKKDEGDDDKRQTPSSLSEPPDFIPPEPKELSPEKGVGKDEELNS